MIKPNQFRFRMLDAVPEKSKRKNYKLKPKPQPERPKVNRPPAVYSNVSRDDLMDKYLNAKI